MISSRYGVSSSPGKRRLAGLLLRAWRCAWRFMIRPAFAAANYQRHRAQIHALRGLSDYQLKDIGLFRYQVGTGLAEETARARSRRQINWMQRGSAGESDGCAGT